MLIVAIPLVLIVIALGLLWWYQTFSHVARHINKIPGPPGYPLLGVFTEYLSSLEQMFQNERDRSLKYFPIYKLWIFNITSAFLLDPDDIEIILSSTKHIKKSKLYDLLHLWLGTGLLTSEGDKWKVRRKMLTPAFHFTILKEFINVFNDATQNLVKNLEETIEEDHIDVVPLITEFTLQSIAETAMGVTLDSKNNINRMYKTAITDFSENGTYRISRPWFFNDNIYSFSPKGAEAKQIVNTLHDFTRNIIKERKKKFTNISYSTKKRLAMLDLILKIQEEEGTIDDEGIREEVDTFLFEGHDTTASALCYIFLLLANHTQVQNEIRQEIIDVIGESGVPTYNDLQNLPYTERCIKECLRLYPSVVVIGRDLKEDVKTSTGFILPKGSMVHIFIYDLHRRPEYYPDPLKFDPDRFLPENVQKRHPFVYIPFSAGSRNCIGQRFAMLELKAVLCGVLRKFVLEPVDKPEDLVFKTDLVLRNANPIRVKFIKRWV